MSTREDGEVPAALSRSTGADVAGVLLVASCAGWALASAAGRQARPEGMLLDLLAVAAGCALGRVGGAVLPAGTPALAALAVGSWVLATLHGIGENFLFSLLLPEAASAALLSLAVGMACCAAVRCAPGPGRVLLLLFAVALAAAEPLTGSALGLGTAVGTVLCTLLALRLRRRLPALLVLGTVPLLVVGATLAVAETDHGDGASWLPAAVSRRLPEYRVQLWQDATELARQHPLRGVGPERFEETSETAQQRSPTQPADSIALEQAAEQGLPGVALLGMAMVWALFSLWRSPRSTPLVVTVAAALSGMAIHGALQDVLSKAAVVGAAGILLGVATSQPMRRL